MRWCGDENADESLNRVPGRPQYDPRLGDLVHTKKDKTTILELNKISIMKFFTLPEIAK